MSFECLCMHALRVDYVHRSETLEYVCLFHNLTFCNKVQIKKYILYCISYVMLFSKVPHFSSTSYLKCKFIHPNWPEAINLNARSILIAPWPQIWRKDTAHYTQTTSLRYQNTAQHTKSCIVEVSHNWLTKFISQTRMQKTDLFTPDWLSRDLSPLLIGSPALVTEVGPCHQSQAGSCWMINTTL